MQAWEIQLLRDSNCTPTFLAKVLYLLVGQGVTYNGGEYRGSYRVIPSDLSEEIYVEEVEDGERPERLANIVEAYCEFSSEDTEMIISLAYTRSSQPVHFELSLYPTENEKCILSFEVASGEITDESRFIDFVHLCKTVFTRLEFEYGSYRNEYEEMMPTEASVFLREKVRTVTLFSSDIANKFGREQLVSTPAYEFSELNNGGILLIACPDPQGCRRELRQINDHLGLIE